MRHAFQTPRTVRATCSAVIALSATAGSAMAGGFEVREQSTYFQGMSFAGAAAGGSSLSSMFWNPAAAGYAEQGLSFESGYSLIIPRADVTVEEVNGVPVELTGFGALDTSVDFGRDALVPASYMAYRLSNDLVLAMSINSQFGLSTKSDSKQWAGDILGRTSKVFSVNAAPTIAYQIAPGVQVGAGLQLQYFDLVRFSSAVPVAGRPTAALDGDDFGVGFTLGVNFTPAAGTSIGIGYRSSISHDLKGDFSTPGPTFPISADLDLPEKITASLIQAIMPGVRASATVEWTNWSRLGVIPINGAPQPTSLDFQWEDGWYFAVGGEYDYSADLTLRAGFAYEISPIDDPSQRLVQLPDDDRYWLSAGASYKVGDVMGLLRDATVDLAYSHVFVDEGNFERHPAAAAAPVFTGSTESAVDIISIGIRSKL